MVPKFVVVVASLALLAPVVSAWNDEYTYSVTNGGFTVDQVLFESPLGFPWGPGVTANCRISGVTHKKITAGTLKYDLYEDTVAHFESNGNLPYFQCNNKGCNVHEPVTLTLEDPEATSTRFDLLFSFTMPKAKSTGDFRLVVFGQDQDHYPYDFSSTINYNYSFNAEAAESAPVIPRSSLRGSNAPAAYVPELSNPIDFNITNGAFHVHTVSVTTPSGRFVAGETAKVEMTGVIPSKHILAGTVQYKIYEFGAQHFIASGNAPYFQCTNKGCNPGEPVALSLAHAGSVPTTFQLTLELTVPNKVRGAANPFELDVWGVDQDHNPYDFSVNIRYHLDA